MGKAAKAEIMEIEKQLQVLAERKKALSSIKKRDKKEAKYGPPDYKIDPSWKMIAGTGYWIVTTPHGQLVINTETPDIRTEFAPEWSNNMNLDCFQLGRLFKSNPKLQKSNPEAWHCFKPFADTNKEEYERNHPLPKFNLIHVDPPKIDPAPKI